MTYNIVRAAVDAVGGATRVANKLGVSSSTVHSWIQKGRVPNYDRAEALAALSKISMRQLRGA